MVVSQNERIMLHLLELDKFREEPDVPMGASQEGIAEKLGTQVFNASRALSSIEADGLVFDRLAHVRGAPKRRRAYFLTEKGKTTTAAIRADIGKRMVVVEHAGKVQELQVNDAVQKLTSILGRTVGFSEIVELAREFDTVLSSSLAGPLDVPAEPKEFVVRAHGRPKVGSFFGRDPEMKSILEAVAGEDVSAVLIWGMPGIGKSTLASKAFESLVGKRPLFWYTLREWDTEASFLSMLTEFLSACGRTGASNSFRRGASSSEMYLPVLSDMSGLGAVLFIDDVQKPAKDLSPLLHVVVEAVKSSGSCKVILISRSVPSFFSKTERGNRSVELTGMDRDSAWKLAQSLNSRESIRLVDESHGHPLLLTLMARGGVSEAKGDVISFIEREVYSAVTENERQALGLLSIYRHPVPLDALEGTNYKVVTRLRSRALVVEQEDGIWTHDLIREFFVTHLGKEAKESLHRKAASYCERVTEVEWLLESLYHHVEGRDWAGAARIAIANAESLGKEFPEETLALLSRSDLKPLEKDARAQLLFVRGQLSESFGKHEAALSDIGESLALLGPDADPSRRALVLETSARLQSQIQRWTESLDTHQKALRLYEKNGDAGGQAREWLNIGGVLRRKGDLSASREAYDRALSLSTKEENRTLQAASLNNIGLLEWDEGHPREAERRIRESITLAQTIKDHSGEAHGFENLGELLESQGKLDDASEAMMEAAEAYKRAGETEDHKRLLAARAGLLGMLGRHGEGIELCRKALAKPELKRRKGLFQRVSGFDAGDLALSSAVVDLLMMSGEFKHAQEELERYMSMSQSGPSRSMVVKGKLTGAVLKEDLGELGPAEKLLDAAEEMLRDLGDDRGLIAVFLRRGIVHEKMGNDPAAEKDYSEAARLALLVREKAAWEIARNSLASLRSG